MTFTTPNGDIVTVHPSFSIAVLAKPMPCGCGRAAMLVVNRNGATKCSDCDKRAEGGR